MWHIFIARNSQFQLAVHRLYGRFVLGSTLCTVALFCSLTSFSSLCCCFPTVCKHRTSQEAQEFKQMTSALCLWNILLLIPHSLCPSSWQSLHQNTVSREPQCWEEGPTHYCRQQNKGVCRVKFACLCVCLGVHLPLSYQGHCSIWWQNVSVCGHVCVHWGKHNWTLVFSSGTVPLIHSQHVITSWLCHRVSSQFVTSSCLWCLLS